ncbi:MAG: hypothetical protein AAFR56_02215, partial [Chloroflexota bacterium]
MTVNEQSTHRIDRLLDAIDLIKEDRREEARVLLRQLINEDGNFEDAWLWMSVAVDSIDQSYVCLDNVLRVNPSNHRAAGAFYRIREPEIKMQRRRGRYLIIRDVTFITLWIIVLFLLFLITFVP